MVPTLLVIGSYLLGSVPFGWLAARARAGVDIRTVGSGNIGATNVRRVLGNGWFAVVLALDLLKGLLPAALATRAAIGLGLTDPPAWLPVACALAAILGHNFPIYLKFRGGKGVATSLGAVLGLDPIGAAIALGVFAVAMAATRIMSLASLVAASAFVIAWFVRCPDPGGVDHRAMSGFAILGLTMMLVRHRANLVRIARGTEPKFWGGTPGGTANDPKT